MMAPVGDTRWGYFIFPAIWRLRDGRLVCAVALGEDEMPSEADFHHLWYLSDDGGRHWTHAVVTEDEARDFLRQRTTLSNGRQLYFEPKIVRVDNLDLRPYPGNVPGWLGAFGPIKVVYRLGDLPEEHRHVRMFTREPGSPDW